MFFFLLQCTVNFQKKPKMTFISVCKPSRYEITFLGLPWYYYVGCVTICEYKLFNDSKRYNAMQIKQNICICKHDLV